MKKWLWGYTAAEALVTLFIVAIVMTLSLANYRTAQDAALLRQTTINVEGALRDAQQHALAGTTTDSDANYGYGVHFYYLSADHILFADQKDSVGNTPGDSYYQDTQDFLFPIQPEDRPSKVGLYISVVGSGSCVTTNGVSTVDIVYKPPLPETSISVVAGDVCDIACLDLSLYGMKSRVKVTRQSGLIEAIKNPPASCS